MTTRQLAKRNAVTQSAVVDAERAEANGHITLATLRRYARALNCELVYALVPTRSLEEQVVERAESLAREQVARVRHSMAPEDQQASLQLRDQDVAELKRNLLEGRRSRLWQ